MKSVTFLKGNRFILLMFTILINPVITIKNGDMVDSDVQQRKRDIEVQKSDNHLHLGQDATSETFAEGKVHIIGPGFDKLLTHHGQARLEIFCYKGESKHLKTVLKTVELVVKVPGDNFQYFEGNNITSIENQYNDASWFHISPWKRSSFKLSLYNFSCIGISTAETFRASLIIRYIDLWRVVALVLGLAMFLMAPLLAHNVAFHYMTGVSIGVFGSLLVIIYILSRNFQKKVGALSFLISGWGLVLYGLQYLWSNCTVILKEYQTLITGYIVVAGLISFAIVYRIGPLEDIRSLKLVQWALQLMGLSVIFVSSQYKEFSLALALILLANYNFPASWRLKIQTYWLLYFPPKPKFISEGEYLEQGRTETKKALDDLRQFCHSPKCNAWKTMSVLKSPQRFAEFVDGSSHLTDDEIMEYETTNCSQNSSNRMDDDWMTSDEDEER